MAVISEFQAPTRPFKRQTGWPRITVVTPSLNQGVFLERALQSVLSQQYPNCEYFVFDAGSTDESLDILSKYDRELTYWTSESDHGQSDAISKGWNMATGDILAWLNSDDFYYPKAFEEAGQLFQDNPNLMMLCGTVALVDEKEKLLRLKEPPRLAPELLLRWANLPPQPGVFIRREVFERIGGPRLDLHYVMDWELWLRFSLNFPAQSIGFTNRVLAADRRWIGTKTLNAAGEDAQEVRRVLAELFSDARVASRYKSIERPALARAWWRQSKGELRRGARAHAFTSLTRALLLCPTAFNTVKVFRQARRILFAQRPHPLAPQRA
jgi:glycosyltransferase involved in cell wall biosynthesis